MEQYTTAAARQELALREAAKTGNRHMRRKGKKILRDVPPPRPWFAFQHPDHGMIGVRLNHDGTAIEAKLASGISDENRIAAISWAIQELKAMATGQEAPCSDASS